MKIYIYAIAKNEKKFAERFMRSCAGADGVVVLDTGSTDGTPDALRALGAEVSVAELIPWRFDRARNFALSLVPADADVCVALDPRRGAVRGLARGRRGRVGRRA